jgi:glycogen operon protein
MLSHGVPMILSGDEVGRSQRGNNNAYCQDNDISWFDWTLTETNAGLLRFFRLLIRLRADHPILRRETFGSSDEESLEPSVEWHGVALHQPDWSYESRTLAMHLHGCPNGSHEHIYLISNAHWEAHEFELPVVPGWCWVRVVDTSLAAPDDIAAPGREVELANSRRYAVGARSTVVLLGRPLSGNNSGTEPNLETEPRP